MASVDPGRYANQREALRPHPSDYHGPPPPKRKRIRRLVKLLIGRQENKGR